MAPLAQEFGVRRMVEAWADDVPEGKVTDFKRSVKAEPGETVVFSWFEFPSKELRDATSEKFINDPRTKEMGANMPFDGKRLIYGGFKSIVEEGSGHGGYVDGWVVPVPEAKRDAYQQLAAKNAKYFVEYGATRVVEAIADDVPKGEVTRYTFAASKVFPGTTREYTVYVPKQYDPAKPACLWVNQDGVQFKAPAVFGHRRGLHGL